MQVTIGRQLDLDRSTVSNFFMNARRRSSEKWKEDVLLDDEDDYYTDFEDMSDCDDDDDDHILPGPGTTSVTLASCTDGIVTVSFCRFLTIVILFKNYDIIFFSDHPHPSQPRIRPD